VAGPNGAGKSSLSTYLSRAGAIIFDPDIELKKLEERMPDLPEENLYHALNYAFENAVREAISAGSDFTVESNLRDDEIIETVKRFKQNGYNTSFVFIALKSFEESRLRVDQRIKEGGHCEGRKGVIKKRIVFMPTDLDGVYNLAFGDVDEDGEVDDYSVSDNGDRNKILATVVAAVLEYTKRYPQRYIYFQGSTVERTRLYRMAISLNYTTLAETFNIYSQTTDGTQFVMFDKKLAAKGFLIKRKKS